ncbi:MAG: 1,4-beta-mannosyl-N-acetylglucosamine phosphorylase [Syntrophomonadaceae bacterium]|nr:1,4-beta-mannosyl-N-acetylglucosamine phosphorylase [Bacillota bacterium]
MLDLNNPLKIIARTEYPILTPEEYYERFGMVPNIVFPSGAIIKDNWINLYYGAADTTCCLARIKLSSLLDEMLKKEKRTLKLNRAKENPIIVPNKAHNWEAKATFNPGAIYLKGEVHLLYRAMSEDNTSVLGYARSADGIRINERLPEPAYVPRELFEQKTQANENSGCEDPRLTQIGNRIYMLYTAFNGKTPRVALSWISVEDFLKQKWNWSKPITLSPHNFGDKNAVLFPEKFNGNYIIIHRIGNDIDLAMIPSLDFETAIELGEYRWLTTRKGWWDSKRVGAAAPPIKTKDGWIFLYHGISDDGIYRIGAVLLDLKNPTKIIARTDKPIFEPEATYEKEGLTPNVVFPCGAVIIGKKLFVYYGGADKVVGVASIEVSKLLAVLKLCKC